MYSLKQSAESKVIQASTTESLSFILIENNTSQNMKFQIKQKWQLKYYKWSKIAMNRVGF